jgi:hypothetical protein
MQIEFKKHGYNHIWDAFVDGEHHPDTYLVFQNKNVPNHLQLADGRDFDLPPGTFDEVCAVAASILMMEFSI